MNFRPSLLLNDSANGNLVRRSIIPTKTMRSNTIDSKSNSTQNADFNCKIEYYKLVFVYYI